MWIIIISLVAGIAVGYFDLLPEKLNQTTDYLVFGGLFLLIFSMGVQIGANPKVVTRLGQLGFKAIILAAGSVVGSLIFILVFEYYWED